MFRQKEMLRWTTAVVMLLSTSLAMATLQDDYAVLVESRKNLEVQRKEYEHKVKDQEKKRRLAEKKHLECAHGKWRVLWETRVKEANKARAQLEDKNRLLIKRNLSLQQRNRELEAERQKIESTHKHKGSNYEADFRHWMNKLETEYLLPLEHELFRDYQEYINGIDRYLIFVDSSADACLNRDYGPAAIETARMYILQILEAVEAIKDTNFDSSR